MPATPAVRAATAADASTFARIVVEALHTKYRPALGRAAVDGAAALVAAGIRRNAGSRHMVADIDGRVAGVVHLSLGPSDDHVPLTDALIAAVGRRRALRARLVLGLLGPHAIAADTGYIDGLAVAPWARRRGVARSLLAACAATATDAGKSRLTLMVTTDNTSARALYEAEGFVTVGRRRWLLARVVFGAPGAVFMERSLPPG